MLPQDLSPDQLDAPDAAASKLDFTVLTRGDLLLLTNATIQWRTVQQTSERIEHLRNAIVGKHGDLVDVMKTTIAFTIEAGPQISYQDLRSLVEADQLAVEVILISKAREIVYQKVNQSSSRAVCFGYAVCEAAIEALVEHLARFSQTTQALFQEWNLFICSGSKDMAQHILRAFLFILPEVRRSDWDTYILVIN